MAAELRVFLDIQHPNLLKMLAACFTVTDKFLLLEYLPRGDLASLIHNPVHRAEVSWNRRGREIALQISRGLLALHANSCVHRDIKTSNILMSQEWQAKISDFGQSKLKSGEREAIEQTTTPSGERQRSAAYASPEQLSDTAPVLFPSDIYSFGVLLWEIYTQTPPYVGKTMIQVLMAISASRTLDLPGDMPPLLRHLVAKCWSADPASRPTAQDCVDILQELCSDSSPANHTSSFGGGEEDMLTTYSSSRRRREARFFPLNMIQTIASADSSLMMSETFRPASLPFAPLAEQRTSVVRKRSTVAVATISPAGIRRETSAGWDSDAIKLRQLSQLASLQSEMAASSPTTDSTLLQMSASELMQRPVPQPPRSPEKPKSRSRRTFDSAPPPIESGLKHITIGPGPSSPTSSAPLPSIQNGLIFVSKNFLLVAKGSLVERLIQELCSPPKADSPFGDNFREIFLLTFRTVMTPAELFGHLVTRLQKAQNGELASLSRSKSSGSGSTSPAQVVAETKRRIAQVLQAWMTRHRQDFLPPFKYDVSKFISTEFEEPGMAEQLLTLLERGPAPEFRPLGFSASIPPRNATFYDDYDVAEMAKQLCLIHQGLFGNVFPHDLVNAMGTLSASPSTWRA